MSRTTPLHALHRRLGARMVDFGGWDMPLAYGSQIEEHHAVRRAVGLFDVSHMTIVDVQGGAARAYFRRLLANDVDKLKTPGKALYGCMLNEHGGVIDDLIVYFLGPDRFRAVVNAATRDKDLAWMQKQAEGFELELEERRDLAMIAVQGPQARDHVAAVLGPEHGPVALALGRFQAAELGGHFVARTGYTGEDGFEVMLPAERAEEFWEALRTRGAMSCGLGARDTLRLEAAMNLYGQDMDEHTTPWESGLGWTVALDPQRDFIGRDALIAQRAAGVPRQLVGLVLDDKGVLRHGQTVHTPLGPGLITSGSYAPTVGKSIALARVPTGAPAMSTDFLGATLEVEIRGKRHPVRVVKPPFVRAGRVADGL